MKDLNGLYQNLRKNYLYYNFTTTIIKTKTIMEQDIYAAGQEGFNLPHDVIQLPTQGVFYKSKKKSIKVGYLTAVDENILSDFDGRKNITESIILPLLRNKLYEKDLRPEELLDGDVEAILLFLRNTAFGPEYKLTLIDPKTEDTFVASIMLDELNYKKTEHQVDENGFFNTVLPVSKRNVTLKLLSLADRMEIERIIKSYPSERVAPTITTRLNKHIVSIDGNDDRVGIATFVESMPIGDSKFIRKFVLDNEPRLDLKKEVIAPSGEKAVVDVAFGVEFFRPFFAI